MKKHSTRLVVLQVLTMLALLLAACAGLTGESAPTEDPNVGGGIGPTATTAPAGSAPTQAAPDQPAVPTEDSPSPTDSAATSEQPTPAAGAPIEATAAPVTDAPVQAENVTNFPDPSGFAWQQVVTGLTRPTDLTAPPDGSGRMMVLEQPGMIRIIQNDGLLPDLFLDLRDRVGSSGNEQGLLGLAFHPQYTQNGFFYLNYTDRNGDTVVARYSVSGGDPNRGDLGSEKVLLKIEQPYANHNGGGMAFGPDGMLYISTGDGGSGGDPQGNGQSLETLLGKILRIDVNNGDPYVVPADNPFTNGGGRPEIWSYGLRNPWRFSFDRAEGDMYIADVGQNAWEEINFEPADSTGGLNYGWDFKEGTHPFEGTPPSDLAMVDPVHEYQHPVGCSVTGGYVYRGQALPEFNGIYLFSDFCTGIVWGMLRGAEGGWTVQELFRTGLMVSSFGEDASGEIYLIDQSTGSVSRLQRQ